MDKKLDKKFFKKIWKIGELLGPKRFKGEILILPNTNKVYTSRKVINDVLIHDLHITKKKTNLYDPFLWMGLSCLKARATSRRQFTFYH